MENNPSPHIFLIPLKFRGKTLLGLAQLSVYIFILLLSFGVPCWYCLTQINGLPYLLSDSIPWCAKFLIVEIYLFIHLLLSFRVTFIHYGFIIYMHSFNWCSLMCLFGIVWPKLDLWLNSMDCHIYYHFNIYIHWFSCHYLVCPFGFVWPNLNIWLNSLVCHIPNNFNIFIHSFYCYHLVCLFGIVRYNLNHWLNTIMCHFHYGFNIYVY